MKIVVITVFPQIFEEFLSSSIIGRTQKKGLVKIKLVNLRDFGMGSHKTVDGRVYGGGRGMVIRADCAVTAIKATKKALPKPVKTILLTPTGTIFTQKMAESLAQSSSLIIFCGHYEGVDERMANFVDLKISIGDYILTGGESAAMVVVDAVTRLVPDVLPKVEHQKESFAKDLLAAPVYTQPANFRGLTVPEVLLSGNKGEVERWRKRQQILRTKKIRPDLFKKYLNRKSDW